MIYFDPEFRIVLCALVWCALVVVTYQASLLSQHRSVGLPLGYVLVTTLMHAGALVHLSPNYDHNANSYLASWQYTKDTVAAGAELSVVGLLFFVVGLLIANLMVCGVARPRRGPSSDVLPVVSKLLVIVGIAATVIGSAGAGAIASVPGLMAIIGGFKNLLLLGVCGYIYHFALMRQQRNVLLAIFAGIVVVVGVQMLTAGILGDSVASAILLLSFALMTFQPRLGPMLKGLAALCLGSYVLLLAALGWLDIRSEVRSAVWSGAGVWERVDAFSSAVAKVRIFDGSYQEHLELLDVRMNHNVVMGKAVEQLSAIPSLYANGETLWAAALGWVPRAIWPEKPERGGSELASLYTGQRLSETTSFGTGPIFEFFINHGLLGVVFGCLIYGFLLRWFDVRSAALIDGANPLKISPYFAAGVVMVTPFNTLMFIVNGAVSAAVAAVFVTWAVGRRYSGLSSRPEQLRR